MILTTQYLVGAKISTGAVSFEHLATLLRQGVEGRIEDAVLIEVGSVGVRVSILHA
jgi:hypothetical protein